MPGLIEKSIALVVSGIRDKPLPLLLVVAVWVGLVFGLEYAGERAVISQYRDEIRIISVFIGTFSTPIIAAILFVYTAGLAGLRCRFRFKIFFKVLVYVILLLFFCFFIFSIINKTSRYYLIFYGPVEIYSWGEEYLAEVMSLYSPVLMGVLLLLLAPLLLRLAFVLPSSVAKDPLGLRAAFRQSRGYGFSMTLAASVLMVPYWIVFRTVPQSLSLAVWLHSTAPVRWTFVSVDTLATVLAIVFCSAVVSSAYNAATTKAIADVWD